MGTIPIKILHIYNILYCKRIYLQYYFHIVAYKLIFSLFLYSSTICSWELQAILIMHLCLSQKLLCQTEHYSMKPTDPKYTFWYLTIDVGYSIPALLFPCKFNNFSSGSYSLSLAIENRKNTTLKIGLFHFIFFMLNPIILLFKKKELSQYPYPITDIQTLDLRTY